jgi:hypothetical protein
MSVAWLCLFCCLQRKNISKIIILVHAPTDLIRVDVVFPNTKFRRNDFAKFGGK